MKAEDERVTKIQTGEDVSRFSHQNAREKIDQHHESSKSFKKVLCGSETTNPLSHTEEDNGNESNTPFSTRQIPSISLAEKTKKLLE